MPKITVEQSCKLRVEKTYLETPIKHELTFFIEARVDKPIGFVPRSIQVAQTVNGKTDSLFLSPERLVDLRDMINKFISHTNNFVGDKK